MNTGTQAEYQSDSGSTKDTPYLALTGELWGVFWEHFLENLLCHNGTALYFEILKAPQQYFCWDACQISEPLANS